MRRLENLFSRLPLARLAMLALLLLLPSVAHAHSLPNAMHGWHDGFFHPLHGWDHLLAMIGVGLWAAQQRGRAQWLLPLVFVAVMAFGGLVGVSGVVTIPGVETAILLSVLVFGALVAQRARIDERLAMSLVGFFAFFHGFAHGAEMPGSASLPSFGMGFIAATLLLHGVGLATARIAALLLACLASSFAVAEEATGVSDPNAVRLPEVVVRERSDSMIGIAESASQGIVGATQLEERPTLRPGEVLETVPGMIVTQHSGEGKANQYFLRGFNLDHGSDFATSVDGIPVNLPTHAHGQGYTDLNFMIPELVRTVSYKKGVYYADEGDFSSAGAANLQYWNVLPGDVAVVEGGSDDYFRSVVATSPKLGRGNLLFASEVHYDDGPWREPAHFVKGNLVLGYGVGDDREGWSMTGMGYESRWDSTDQIAKRAVGTEISRFGTLDASDGGDSQRYSLSAEWHGGVAGGTSRFMAYGYYYGLDLFSNFTYFLSDPVNGDQIEQRDKRWVSGMKADYSWLTQLGPIGTENTVGLQLRNDSIDNGLFNTVMRTRLATTRTDSIRETSVSPYFETSEQWTTWLRSIAGVRLDAYDFVVHSDLAANSGSETEDIVSPKFALIMGPWAQTEFYVNGGTGFHSNDGRGTTTHVQPGTDPPVDVDPVDPLVRTYGAEVGLRTTLLPYVHSTVAFWGLDIDSELLFVGDAGTTEAGRPSRRYGIEVTNFYTPTEWLTVDADFALTHARFTDSDPTGDHIPGSPDAVIAAGVTVHDLAGFFGSVRLRYFGERPLVEDGSVRSEATTSLSTRVGYRVDKRWSVSAEIFNLLNSKDDDITYYYPSRLPSEPPGPDDGGYNDFHFHPVEPRSVRVAVMARF